MGFNARADFARYDNAAFEYTLRFFKRLARDAVDFVHLRGREPRAFADIIGGVLNAAENSRGRAFVFESSDDVMDLGQKIVGVLFEFMNRDERIRVSEGLASQVDAIAAAIEEIRNSSPAKRSRTLNCSKCS